MRIASLGGSENKAWNERRAKESQGVLRNGLAGYWDSYTLFCIATCFSSLCYRSRHHRNRIPTSKMLFKTIGAVFLSAAGVALPASIEKEWTRTKAASTACAVLYILWAWYYFAVEIYELAFLEGEAGRRFSNCKDIVCRVF